MDGCLVLASGKFWLTVLQRIYFFGWLVGFFTLSDACCNLLDEEVAPHLAADLLLCMFSK